MGQDWEDEQENLHHDYRVYSDLYQTIFSAKATINNNK